MTCTSQWILSTLLGLAGVAGALLVGIFAVAVYVRAAEMLGSAIRRRWPKGADRVLAVSSVFASCLLILLVASAATVAHDAVYGCPSCRPAWMGGCEGTTSSSEGAE